MTDLEQYSPYHQAYQKWKDRLAYLPSQQAQKISLILDSQSIAAQGIASLPASVLVDIAETAYAYNPIFDMVSVQPLSGPVDNIFYINWVQEEKQIAMQVFNKEVPALSRFVLGGLRFTDEQSKEDGFAAKIGGEMRVNIFREVWRDLRNNAGTVVERHGSPSKDSLLCDLMEMNYVIHKQTVIHPANWLLTTPAIAEMIGDLNKVKVIVDPLFPAGNILYGYKDELVKGYIYCPYIPVSGVPTFLDHNSYMPTNSLFVRYAKNLVSKGPYALVKYKESQ